MWRRVSSLRQLVSRVATWDGRNDELPRVQVTVVVREEAQHQGLGLLGVAHDQRAQRVEIGARRRRRRAVRRTASAPRCSWRGRRPSCASRYLPLGLGQHEREVREAQHLAVLDDRLDAARRAVGRPRRVRELADDVDAHRSAQRTRRPGLRARPGLEDVDAGLRLLVGVRGGQHHAFAQTELHLARREVGDHHGQLADQVGGLVGRLDAAEDVARLGLADVERQPQQLGRAVDALRTRRCVRCADRPSRSRRARSSARAASPPGRLVGRRPAPRTAHRAASHRRAASGAGTRRSRARRAAAGHRRRRSGWMRRNASTCAGERRQHRLQVDRQQPEGLDADRADLVQLRVGVRPSSPAPRACAGRHSR